jgi:hypothetical protein
LTDVQACRARRVIDGDHGTRIDGTIDEDQRTLNGPASEDPVQRQMRQQ